MRLSKRVQEIEGSRTARFIPLMAEMRRQGRSVISLAIGEPSFDTPAPVIAATKAALDRQETRYSEIPGLTGLRTALADRLDGCRADNIVVFNGSKQALYSIFQTLLDPGDQVIIPLPCWVSFSAQVRLAGGEPVFVPTIDHQLDMNAITTAISGRTRAILINSPNNPTGAVYPREALETIARLAADRDLYLVADEAYDFFVYDGRSPVSLYDLPLVRERLIVTRSFSKHYAMTGFRIGYAVAPADVAAAMIRLHSHLTGNVCTFAQHGALAALSMDDGLLRRRREELEGKRDLALKEIEGLFACIRPGGAFYLFADVRGHLQPGETSGDFAARILEKTGVAMVPGEDFGVDGHVRICFAAPEEQLIEAFKRIREVL
ncbi:pyridoxal phosphate-dependent aminotransferase [Desulfosarcina ovata]|uniref:Aminotransferase n=2 Tax=Desulfosarcina ovata TaxID=83564 RepID=A0A5K8ACY4_9BACT|nr:pyridoxal phosphate-dependent aminotransferase [Desulfosarcina ovata]BBO84085.1 aminotransferase [Desulfosarcina ovata subsp. sediminis]BBO90583.1 aminotransferase [Desulfosarcina ovata subsp. ovata]